MIRYILACTVFLTIIALTRFYLVKAPIVHVHVTQVPETTKRIPFQGCVIGQYCVYLDT